MATMRKYKPPAVAQPDLMPRSEVAPVPEVSAPTAPPAAGPESLNPLMVQIAAQRHAEEMQRQRAQQPQQQPMSVEQHIDALPGLSDHKRAFLKQYPQLMAEPLHHLMRHNFQLALHAGVPDDTPAMDNAILAGVQRDLEHHHRLTLAHARPAAENTQPHQDVLQAAQALAHEAEALLAERPADAPATLTAPRRSMPMTAPVSRDVPMMSGGSAPASQTLSPDERAIAAVSFPHLPKPQAEYEYLKNRRRMHALKASGAIQGDQ